MAEPLKSQFNPSVIAAIGSHVAARSAEAGAAFDRAGFEAMAGAGLEGLELKARAAQIAAALDAHLTADFTTACAILVAALHPETEGPISGTSDAAGLRGWAVMPLADLVAARGAGDLDRAMATLGAMTMRFSAEFAVRPLIAADPPRAMAWMARWAEASNHHLRRLASEGCRPRLPWGMRLGVFVADPAPVLALLERLRDDPSEYVRRSVANNLNDIAKDHPDLAAATAAGWLIDASPARRRMARHALRGLVKAGHAEALAALGLGPAPLTLERLELATAMVAFGGALEFAVVLRLDSPAPREIALDYAIHHQKASGRRGVKVFKWRRLTLSPGTPLRLARRHAIRPITTRVYHDGAHRVEIIVNGAILGGAEFELTGVAAAT